MQMDLNRTYSHEQEHQEIISSSFTYQIMKTAIENSAQEIPLKTEFVWNLEFTGKNKAFVVKQTWGVPMML